MEECECRATLEFLRMHVFDREEIGRAASHAHKGRKRKIDREREGERI